MLENLTNEENIKPFLNWSSLVKCMETYLFAQGQGGLYIIDQHAAQERVKYEYYREKIGVVDSSLQSTFGSLFFLNFQVQITLVYKKKCLFLTKFASIWSLMGIIPSFFESTLSG